jgi:hypothetical protein
MRVCVKSNFEKCLLKKFNSLKVSHYVHIKNKLNVSISSVSNWLRSLVVYGKSKLARVMLVKFLCPL